MSPELTQPSELTSEVEIAQILINAGCVMLDFNDGFTFSSGIHSPIKIDCEEIKNTADDFDKVVLELEKTINLNRLEFDFLCGVIKGGVSFASKLGEKFEKSTISRLGKKQDEERRRLVSGEIVIGSRGLIIEDVLTKGTNSILVDEQIRKSGGDVQGLVMIFDYGFKIARDNLAHTGLKFWSLTTFDHLLQVGLATGFFDHHQVAKLKEWWNSVNAADL